MNVFSVIFPVLPAEIENTSPLEKLNDPEVHPTVSASMELNSPVNCHPWISKESVTNASVLSASWFGILPRGVPFATTLAEFMLVDPLDNVPITTSVSAGEKSTQDDPLS
jgi:hypothetical protein